MVHEPSPQTVNDFLGFTSGGVPPAELDLLVADPGCPWSEARGYRLGYQQVWPPATLPLTLGGAQLLQKDALFAALAPAALPEERPKRERRKRRRRIRTQGGRGVPNDVDYWLTRLEQDVAHELKCEGCQRNELLEQMRERVYSLSAQRLAIELKARYGSAAPSATSIRRRHDPPEQVDSGAETVKVMEPYRSKRFAEWEPYRRGAGPVNELVPGSVGQDVDEPNEDNRARSLLDGGLKTVTIRDAAVEEIATKKLVKHGGGQGVTHVRPPVDEDECREDLEEQASTKFLRDANVNPHDVPWRPVVRERTEASN